MGQSLDALPLEQRLRRYRKFAEEEFRLATTERDPDIRAGHLSMAAGWHVLAEDIEKARGRISAMEAYYRAKDGPRRKDH